MLSNINRLKHDKDFERVFKQGKGCKEDFLYLKFLKNNLKNSRFGFVVSNKFSKKAVVRNKIKRRLRALVKIKLKDIKKGLDVVIVVMPGLEIDNFWELEETVNKLLKKAKILE